MFSGRHGRIATMAIRKGRFRGDRVPQESDLEARRLGRIRVIRHHSPSGTPAQPVFGRVRSGATAVKTCGCPASARKSATSPGLRDPSRGRTAKTPRPASNRDRNCQIQPNTPGYSAAIRPLPGPIPPGQSIALTRRGADDEAEFRQCCPGRSRVEHEIAPGGADAAPSSLAWSKPNDHMIRRSLALV